MTEPAWRQLNRANWDERVAVHLGPGSDYELAALRAGCHPLHAVENDELGAVAGKRLLHLQCHFGVDTLALAQRGAIVTGVDFSAPAIDAARGLAAELGLPATFVQADVYDTRQAVDGEFDVVFTTWGTICWLPDIAGWARVVASMLAPGGLFYFADVHPMALVFDDTVPGSQGMPGWAVPYFHKGAMEFNDTRDYADPNAVLVNARTHEFMHPVASVVQALLDAGLRLEMLREHPVLAWKAFAGMVPTEGGMFRLPGKEWLPLAFSLRAAKP
jgi:SAM-dependent methyltransferase